MISPPRVASVVVMVAGRLAFAALFLGRRSSQPREARATRKDVRARTGIVLQCIAVVVAWNAGGPWARHLPSAGSFLEWLRLITVAGIVVACLWVILGALRALGKQWAFEARLVEGHELVEKGPYRFVRHPIYLGMGGMLVATGVAIAPWWGVVAAVALYAVGTAIRVAVEDRLLGAEFGEAFADYRRRVPAVLPRAWPGRARPGPSSP